MTGSVHIANNLVVGEKWSVYLFGNLSSLMVVVVQYVSKQAQLGTYYCQNGIE